MIKKLRKEVETIDKLLEIGESQQEDRERLMKEVLLEVEEEVKAFYKLK